MKVASLKILAFLLIGLLMGLGSTLTLAPAKTLVKTETVTVTEELKVVETKVIKEIITSYITTTITSISFTTRGGAAGDRKLCEHEVLFEGEVSNHDALLKAYRIWSGEISCEGELRISVEGGSPEDWYIRILNKDYDSGWIRVEELTKAFKVSPGELRILIAWCIKDCPEFSCQCLVEVVHVIAALSSPET